MKKIYQITLLSFVMLPVTDSYAQLSDRVNNPSQFKIGTRPVQGNLGIFLALSTDDIKIWIAKSDSGNADTIKVDKSIIPLVNIKYYVKDNLVFRAGIKTKKINTTREGKIDPLVNGPGLTAKTDNNNVSEFFLIPAIEKHFLNSNLLDPYVIIGIPLGYLRENIVDDEHYDYGDFYEHSMTKNSLAYGIEGYVGLQAFIADLPLALGFELGMAGIGYRGEKYKHKFNSSIGGVETSQTYYTFKDDPLNNRYSKLKSNSFDMDGNARLTLSYYFSK